MAATAATARESETRMLMNWPDLTNRPLPTPTRRIAFGSGANDFAELWLPIAAGPHPVVLLVHGGCWQKRSADLSIMNYIAEELRRRGIAVWNIEYRGVDEAGGGYPGTFVDVGRAADALRDVGRREHLALDRVIAVGHSAGGHLVAWLAARPRIAKMSPLFRADP